MQEALYRKYRPDNLKKLVGQPDAVSLIEKQIKSNNLSHAYLFSGPRGVGKTSLARIIATTLGCDPVFDITEIDAASHNKVCLLYTSPSPRDCKTSRMPSSA